MIDFQVNEIKIAIEDLDGQHENHEIDYKYYIALKQQLLWILQLHGVDTYDLYKG